MNATIHVGDCIAGLRAMPDGSADCCVTSPPYWGLRDYGCDGQIGLESTPDEYVGRLVDVFREVRRVLRDDGTLWLNLGDSYAATTKGSGGHSEKQDSNAGSWMDNRKILIPNGLKPKDLVGIPWRVAFALQADGWWLRQDIIWHKPNPMPESVTDRCTKAHEYVFLLSKSARYYYDTDAVAEDALQPSGEPKQVAQHKQSALGANATGTLGSNYGPSVKNRRSVWTIATQPYEGAHFATMPRDLAERCILAGSRKDGTVVDPFTGAGTTGLVALRAGRRFAGCELNAEYARLARERILSEAPMFYTVTMKPSPPSPAPAQSSPSETGTPEA